MHQVDNGDIIKLIDDKYYIEKNNSYKQCIFPMDYKNYSVEIYYSKFEKPIHKYTEFFIYGFSNIKNILYRGNIVNGLREGKGEMYFNDEYLYIGDWKNNLKHGKGKIYSLYNTDLIIYDGEFKNDMFDGYGISYYILANIPTLIYKGSWRNNLMHGYGELYEDNIQIGEHKLYPINKYDNKIPIFKGNFINGIKFNSELFLFKK